MIGLRAAAARLALILLCAAPAPALADITARYAIGDSKLSFIVEIEDGGDSRFGVDGVFSVIRQDGIDYVVFTKPDARIVARLDDAVAALRSEMPATAADAKESPFLIGGGTTEVQVAGRAAIAWTIGPKGEQALEAAISADPELAPIGALWRRLAETALTALEGRIIPAASQFGPRLRELLAKGTVVRIGSVCELRSVDHVEIDPHRFDLPGPVASPAELREMLKPGPFTSDEVVAPDKP